MSIIKYDEVDNRCEICNVEIPYCGITCGEEMDAHMRKHKDDPKYRLDPNKQYGDDDY